MPLTNTSKNVIILNLASLNVQIFELEMEISAYLMKYSLIYIFIHNNLENKAKEFIAFPNAISLTGEVW